MLLNSTIIRRRGGGNHVVLGVLVKSYRRRLDFPFYLTGIRPGIVHGLTVKQTNIRPLKYHTLFTPEVLSRDNRPARAVETSLFRDSARLLEICLTCSPTRFADLRRLLSLSTM